MPGSRQRWERTELMRFGLAMVLCLAGLVLAAPAWGAPTPGLVAAYAFDEGSGVSAVDASGNGRTGSVVGATWTAGRYGGALSFDGTNDYVSLPGLGTFYNTAFTLEAWVQKATVKNDVGIVGTWAGNGPMLWIDHLATRYQLTLGGSLSSYLDSGRESPHGPVAAPRRHLRRHDRPLLHQRRRGCLAERSLAPSARSNTWRIGAYGSVPGGFFDGLIDEIRVYDRALSTTEVQADMSQPLGITDPGAPTTPGNLAVTGSTGTSISLGWTASTDDTGVSGYHVFADGAAAGTTVRHLVHGHRPHLLHGPSARGRGIRRSRKHVSARAPSAARPRPAGPRLASSRRTRSTRDPEPLRTTPPATARTGRSAAPSWATGRNGTGLSFDGTDDHVSLGSLGTFYNTAFTLEAWVQKSHGQEGRGNRRHLDRQRPDALGRPPGRPPLHDARRQLLLVSRFGPEPGRRAVAAPSGHLRRDDRPLLRRTASRWRRASSPAASAPRTPGGSAPTAPARVASSTAWSTTSVSTTAPSAPARSSSTATTE